MKYRDFLKNLSIFETLSEEIINMLATGVIEKNFYDKEIIFEENTEGEELYIVYSGSVEIFKNYKCKNEKLLSVFLPGSIFGETALFSKTLRTATAVAKGDTVVLCIRSDIFLKIFKNYSDEGIKIVQRMLLNTIYRLEQTSKELATIYAISQKMLDAVKNIIEVSRFIENILSEIVSVLPDYCSCAIYIFNKFNDEYQLVVQTGNTGKLLKEIYDKEDPIIKNFVENAGNGMVVDNEKFYTYKLSDGKNIFGLLVVLMNAEYELSQENKDILNSISNLVSISIATLSTLQEEKEKIKFTISKTKYSF
ncbi:MAG: cyclic nucleotide-binding domain-containing protein [Elusimicrobiota bacterium]|nr:cyclic nucleotide-binding domain-containing protein [Elusimicrobiota bacterium]